MVVDRPLRPHVPVLDPEQLQLQGVPPTTQLYFPSIPFFTAAVGGFGPSHTDKSTGLKAKPAMVSLSWPLIASVGM